MLSNILYMAVLPLIHTGSSFYGLTEEVLTLLPDKGLATRFRREDVQAYIDLFNSRADKYLGGGGVAKYVLNTELVEGDLIIVQVIQNVQR